VTDAEIRKLRETCDPHTASLCDLALGEAPWDRRGAEQGRVLLIARVMGGISTTHKQWKCSGGQR
jgi:hypothetical protein